MIKPSHDGRLHRALGVAQGEKMPESKLQAARHSRDPARRKQATFAENARHWTHGGAHADPSGATRMRHLHSLAGSDAPGHSGADD
jgi:hypothetical protein